MTPLQEFRYWARRAPVSERAVAGIAGAIVVALLAWLLVPGPAQAPTEVVDAGTAPPQQVVAAGAGPEQPGGGEETVTTNPAATGSTVPATAARPAGPGRSEVAQSAGGGPAATLPADDGGCVSPPGSARGITPSEIRIAVTLTNIVGPAANSVFGVATPDQQRAWYEAVIGAINASGGVACRKLVPRYFPANPADQNNLQQTCLDIAEAGVFAEIDNGSYANYPQKQCFAQHQIPYFGAYFLTRSEKERFYPYLFNMAEYDTLARNTILGLRQRGFFDPAAGFKKLGFLYHDCDKGLVDTALTAIAQAGVPSSQLVTYNVGCPTTFASPADLAQAVLRFRQSGVTHVSFVNFVGDFSNFTNVAEQQGFRPRLRRARRGAHRHQLREPASECRQHRRRDSDHGVPQRRGAHAGDDPEPGNGQVRRDLPVAGLAPHLPATRRCRLRLQPAVDVPGGGEQRSGAVARRPGGGAPTGPLPRALVSRRAQRLHRAEGDHGRTVLAGGPVHGGLQLLAGRRRHLPAELPVRRTEVATTAGTAPEVLLRVSDLDFAYGSLQVLFGIALEVRRGEALALVGTNGAGKSTLLRVIAGLERPGAGRVVFAGRDVTGVAAERLAREGLVLIPGGRAVFTDMTVAENLEIQALALRSRPSLLRERRELVFATFPRLRERLSRVAGTLSGGEQQQLALAKALLLRPELLLIDELSLGLAPVVVAELMEVVARLNAEGVTLVVVEQSLNIAARLCERAVFLEKGQVRFEGRTADLLERNDIARAVFLGSAPEPNGRSPRRAARARRG